MNQQRLEHLITVLERVRDAKLPFDMEHWLRSERSVEEPCGTSACAGGYAALDPEFQAQGLGLVITPNGFIHEILASPKTAKEFNEAAKEFHHRIPVAMVTYGGSLAFDSLEEFFDITEQATNCLFDPSEYRDLPTTAIEPEDVIARVRRVIECDGGFPPELAAHDEEDEEDEEE